MAKYGEWNRKGATLSDVTATNEYGVSRNFILKGIQAGKLEYREGAIWENPYLRVLRSQLEQYIKMERGFLNLLCIQSELSLTPSSATRREGRSLQLSHRPLASPLFCKKE